MITSIVVAISGLLVGWGSRNLIKQKKWKRVYCGHEYSLEGRGLAWYECSQIVDPVCVNRLCKKHCSTLGCGCAA